MQMQQNPATAAAPQELPPGTRPSMLRGPSVAGESGVLDSAPQVLARIPSLAGEPLDCDAEVEGAGQSRMLGSRTSLKILAAVGGALFLLALWGFVFDRNKSKDESSGPVSTKEPFRPEVPAPNAPEAPRWAGIPASTDPRAGEARGPISAEARPAPADSTVPGGPWMGSTPPSPDRSPVAWTLSEQSASPASRAWDGQDAGRTEPAVDWTTQPYPSTADRTKAPMWDLPAGTNQPAAAAAASRRDAWPSDATAAGRAAVNPVYRDDRDPSRAAPTAYTGPASSGSQWPAADPRAADIQQAAPGASNRPVSLAQRPSLDRQLPAPSGGTSQDRPDQNPGPWNWNPPASSRGPLMPGAGMQAPADARGPGSARQDNASPFRSPGASDYRAPFSSGANAAGNGAASSSPAAPNAYASPSVYPQSGTGNPPSLGTPGAYTPAPGYTDSTLGTAPGAGYAPAGAGGPAGPWNQRPYSGTSQPAPAASPTPPSNPYHNLLPMYQAPPGNQPMLPPSTAEGYRYGAGGQVGGYGPANGPVGGNTSAPGSIAYPPSYSLPVTR